MHTYVFLFFLVKHSTLFFTTAFLLTAPLFASTQQNATPAPSQVEQAFQRLFTFWKEIKVSNTPTETKTQLEPLTAPYAKKEPSTPVVELSPQKDIELLFHKATYTIELEKNNSEDVEQVNGFLTIELREEGNHYILEEKSSLFVYYTDSSKEKIESRMICKESKDSLQYDFHFTVNRDGVDEQIIEGSASRPTKDGPISVYFMSPLIETTVLPAGVIFPLAHKKKIMQAVRNGAHVLSEKVFDGGNNNPGAQEIITYMASSVDNSFTFLQHDTPFSPKKCFKCKMSFYSGEQSSDMEPDYKIDETFFDEGGVTASRTLNYGDLLITATLTDIVIYTPTVSHSS